MSDALPIAEFDTLDDVLVDHNQLVDTAQRVATEGITLAVSLEMEHLVDGIYQAHVKGDTKVGLEGILQAAWNMIVRFFEKIKETFMKMVRWIKGGKHANGEDTTHPDTTVKAVEEVSTIVKDPELKHSIDTILAEAAKVRTPNTGTEDYFPYQNNNTTEHFENFRKSLSSDEVDFLTSGHRYKILRDAVKDFVEARFPSFMEHFDKDLLDWGDRALEKAIHVGSDFDVVTKFITEQAKQYKDILRKYQHQVDKAENMALEYDEERGEGSYDRLYLFYRKPSELYPHIERLWNEIHFERIGDQDKQLLSAMDGIIARYDKLIQKYRAYAVEKDRDWPAEQEMLKLIAGAHREGARVMGNILRIANYLRRSVTTAFQVTMKAFSYLVRVFHIISMMQGVDTDKVKKSLEIIQDRRKKLIAVLSAIS